MKKMFLLIMGCFLLTNCSKEHIIHYNPYIPEMNVNLVLNLNLPLYNALNYPNNAILEPSQGYNGVIVYNTGMGYVAYEATCSNHAIDLNSYLTIDGQLAFCNSCNREYFLLNGQPGANEEDSPYFLKAYYVSQQGNILTITN